MSSECMYLRDLGATIGRLADMREHISLLGENDCPGVLGCGIFPALNAIDCAIAWMLKLDYRVRSLEHSNELKEMDLQDYNELFKKHELDAYSDEQIAKIKDFIALIDKQVDKEIEGMGRR